MRKAAFTTPKFRTAVHEAGHAVVAHCLDIKPEFIRLYPGDSKVKMSDRDYDFAKLEDIGAALIAGDLSELHHFGEVLSPSLNDQDDFYRLCLTEYQRRSALWKAQDLVRQNADHIWQLASMLSHTDFMSGERLAKALAGAGMVRALNIPQLGTWKQY